MSLKDVVQARIMEDMIKSVTGNQATDNEWKVLVLDKEALRVLSSAIRMFEVTDAGVTIVENLVQKRQPLKSFEAIYFVAPTRESVDHIVADFEPGRVHYKAAHIYTTAPVSDNLFKWLTSSDVAKYIKKFTELNLDFLTVETNVFSLDRPLEFYMQYSPNAQDRDAFTTATAGQLATVCVTLGEYPYVAYLNNHERNYKLALALQSRLDQFAADGELNANQPNRGQLLVVDRSADVITPLLHELTYQAMAYDLLPIIDDVYKYKGSNGQEKVAILSESDDVWTTVRHLHIADTVQHLTTSFKEFREQSKTVKQGQGNNLKDLQAILKAAPQLAEQTAKFELHFDLTSTLQRIEDKTNLDDLCVAEQDLVIGEDGEGMKKNPLLNIIQHLQSSKVPVADKIRLLALYVVKKDKGISTSDLAKLFDQAQISQVSTHNANAITNMDLLDITVSSDHIVPRKQVNRKQRSLEGTYTTSRWTPLLKDLLEGLVEGRPDKMINYVKGAPAKGSQTVATSGPVSARTKMGWAKKGALGVKDDKTEKYSGPRLIVYVMGGMSLSEMRVAAEIMRATNRQVIIGSSARMVPDLFVTNLANLRNSPSVAADTILNYQPKSVV